MDRSMDDQRIDEGLRRFLAGRADQLADLAIGDAEMVGRIRVAGSRPRRKVDWRYLGLAAAVAALLLLGTYLVAVQPLPGNPEPSITSSFDRPFTFTIPAGSGLEPTSAWDTVGLAPTDEGPMRTMYADLLTLTGDEVIAEWNAVMGQVMTGFTVGGAGGDRGVIVAIPSGTTFGNALWCFGPYGPSDPRNPSGYLLDYYRPWLPEGGTLSAPEPLSVDSYRAVTLETPSARCPTTPSERTHVDPQPGVLTVVDLRIPPAEFHANGDQLVVVSIWADDQATLEAWLPTANDFVSGIHFLRPSD
jgi:hypothetical protein